MELEKLKAKAYDLIAKMDAHNFALSQIRKELEATNGEIQKLSRPVQMKAVKKEKAQ